MEKLCYCMVAVTLFYSVHATIEIKEIASPSAVELGSTDEIVMDCDFSASNESDLVIKWYFNGDIHMIYQWIPERMEHGSGVGWLKNHLDLNYKATNDPSTMYRALKFRNISQKMTGNYTCKVSGLNSEDDRTKQLIIYSPAKTGMELILFEKESFIICTVNGIFPMPRVDFYLERQNGIKENLTEDIDIDPDDNGYFNVTAKHSFNNYTLNGPTRFVCNMSIPGTDYYLTKTLDHLVDCENGTDCNSSSGYFDIKVNVTKGIIVQPLCVPNTSDIFLCTVQTFSEGEVENSAVNFCHPNIFYILLTILLLIK